MQIHLGHVELPVSDSLRSMAFYVDTLGFKLEVNQADRFIWVTSGDVVLLLRPGFAGVPDDDLAGVNLVLYTSALDAARAALEARGVAFESRANCLHFRDPDGHWLQLVDPGHDHSG